jgi:hypothetical protein
MLEKLQSFLRFLFFQFKLEELGFDLSCGVAITTWKSAI